MTVSNSGLAPGEAIPGAGRHAVSRRGFLLAAGGALIGSGAAGADAFSGALRRVEVTRTELAIAGLPVALQGLTIAHLSDIHLYDGVHPGARRTIELVQEARPDVTFVTGDIVESLGQLAVAASFLKECRGRLTTVVTLGNWEHAMGVTAEDMERTCAAAGAVFLMNDAHLIGEASGRLALVGLDDPYSGTPDPVHALRDVPGGSVEVWGFHAPGYSDRLRRKSLPPPHLMLAGHTHGGQIRVPPLPAITPRGSGRFVAGWYRDTFAPLFVSRGIGTSDVRARLFCPPEVGVITLVSA
jgi:predicted MPP superfamily phosphohydrolase